MGSGFQFVLVRIEHAVDVYVPAAGDVNGAVVFAARDDLGFEVFAVLQLFGGRIAEQDGRDSFQSVFGVEEQVDDCSWLHSADEVAEVFNRCGFGQCWVPFSDYHYVDIFTITCSVKRMGKQQRKVRPPQRVHKGRPH